MVPAIQLRVALALLAVMLATVAGVDALAHSRSLARLVDERRERRWAAMNWQMEHMGSFKSFEARLILQEMPGADYSNGSVVFIGASTVKSGVAAFALPDEERLLIHNYGFSAATHVQQFQLVRHLVEHDGLLAAGGERSLVVLGLHYPNSGRCSTNRGYFRSLFTEDGLYAYDEERGVLPIQMSALERRLRTERALVVQFTRNALTNWDAGVMPTHPHDLDAYRAFWEKHMCPTWHADMRSEVATLGEMIEYLQRRGARVVAVLLPLPTWHLTLPYVEAFRSQVEPLARAHAVPLVDLTRLLPDDDFADSTHVNYVGTAPLSGRLVGLARHHLRATGALPPCGPAPAAPFEGLPFDAAGCPAHTASESP